MDNAQVTEADRNLRRAILKCIIDALDTPQSVDDRTDDIDRLIARHRLERSEPVGWMGIESAPKDWTDVLVFSPEHEGFNCGGVFSAFYAEGEENCWFAHGPAHNIRLNPTHWRPLPSAPGTTPPEPVAEIERLRKALKRLSDERTLQTTIPEGPWTPEMVAEFQSKEVGHMRDLARAALGDAS